jgi:hypothetical protein
VLLLVLVVLLVRHPLLLLLLLLLLLRRPLLRLRRLLGGSSGGGRCNWHAAPTGDLQPRQGIVLHLVEAGQRTPLTKVLVEELRARKRP